MKYLTVTEIKDIWNLPERTIRNYCQVGKIKGVKHEGKKWLIPENATKPVLNAVVKKGSKKQKEGVKEKPVFVEKPIEEIKEEKPAKEKVDDVKIEDTKQEVVRPDQVVKYRLGGKIPLATYDTKKDPRFQKDILAVFAEEKKNNIKNEFYDLTKFYFVFSALKYENYKITYDELKCLFNLSPEYIKNLLKVSDYVNAINLGFAFDEVYKTLNTKLSVKLLFEWDKLLRKSADLLDSELELANQKKDKTGKCVEKFISKLDSKQKYALPDIVKNHMAFLNLNYFGKTNERLVRMLDLRLCLKSGIKPAIISENLKHYYSRGVQEYNRQQMFLIDTYKTAETKYVEFLQNEYSLRAKKK